MKIVHLKHPVEENLNTEPTAMALGYFDGVHVGHQKVIRTAKEIADTNNLQSAVMTFNPHPSVVLGKNPQKNAITPIEDKQEIIASLGIDILYIVKFDKPFAGLHPQQFVDQYIIGLNVQHIIAGFDFTYGRKGEGTMETIPFLSRDKFDFTVIKKVVQDGEKVSSTEIRQLLKKGNIEKANQYLGYAYRTTGVVIHGDNRGHTIGFPTANIKFSKEYWLPATGVYIVRMKLKGNEWVNGVCNVGYKPTFNKDKKEKSIEVHLLDFNGNIYDEEVTIEWKKKIRDEVKFQSVDDLIKQIENDKHQAIQYFGSKQ